jgi:hypothetical protein
MLIKVRRGTPLNGSESLCDTCTHSRIVRGHRLEDEIVLCDGLAIHAIQITFKVTSCSDYMDDSEPPYHELLERAWILRPASQRRPAGFVRASDLRDEEMARFAALPFKKP